MTARYRTQDYTDTALHELRSHPYTNTEMQLLHTNSKAIYMTTWVRRGGDGTAFEIQHFAADNAEEARFIAREFAARILQLNVFKVTASKVAE
jgi:hypothetical protein